MGGDRESDGITFLVFKPVMVYIGGARLERALVFLGIEEKSGIQLKGGETHRFIPTNTKMNTKGKMMVTFSSLFFCLVMSLFPMLAPAEPITTGSLIDEMADMNHLIEFPDPMYETVQFSSYDHRSTLPGGPDWFANSDGFGGEPVPNFEKVLKKPGEDGVGEYLICDVEGPGALVRVWTAAIEGTIRMYLDSSPNPIFHGAAQDFLSNPYKIIAAENQMKISDLSGTFQQRNAGYFPIPFEKRCRIVWRGHVKRIHFYQIQIRLYEEEAQVTTFQPGDFETYQDNILKAIEILKDPDKNWQYASSSTTPLAAVVSSKETQEILNLEGPKAIECLTLKVYAGDLDKALRQTILHITFDDYPWGQVQCPIGDFFGAAPGINPFNSVPFTVHPDGTMTCRYIMPFAKSAVIKIDNRGDQQVTVSGNVRVMDYDWNEQSMHFRARWRVDHDLVASNRAVQDLPYLIANGKGLYAGSAVMLLNPNPIPWPYGSWWGEGDEKIFVDDDVRPSTFGTGSEDYYNYAWSSPEIFVHPYFGQPRNDGPANRGFVTNHRWHILDPLPFQERIAFYMELFSHERTPGVSYARIGYHYGRPGLMDDHVPITDEDVRPLSLPNNWMPEARMGADNSVFYQTENILRGSAEITFDENNIWSGGKAMIWHPQNQEDNLTLALPIEEEGRYKIRFATVQNENVGTFSVQLNGEQLNFESGESVANLYVPYRTLNRIVSSQDVELRKGEQVLTIRFEGTRPRGGGNTLGIDFVWLQKR